MNTFLMVFLGVLLTETAICTGLKYAWQSKDFGKPWYLPAHPEVVRNASLLVFNRFHYFSTVVLLDTGTPGTSREFTVRSPVMGLELANPQL